jgi:hypothetical protein
MHLVSSARCRARVRGLVFELTTEQAATMLTEQQGPCALTGRRMTIDNPKGKFHNGTNVSLDRIDSSRGYVAGNVRLVCVAPNLMKGENSDEELLSWCRDLIVHREKTKENPCP